jgi:hypothetical protein
MTVMRGSLLKFTHGNNNDLYIQILFEFGRRIDCVTGSYLLKNETRGQPRRRETSHNGEGDGHGRSSLRSNNK